ncbi:MAG: hypothetical protein PHZ11_02075 [Desulfitobacteriaceae bacterium]|nr:hypothetical protein [Desulfitobacteriaceae bacterium]MDD4345683.1 hypothetical protein [Desulfitobacteriaceae bacterium]MDD4401913.1 hypothetical protein [Desulfitobacteriaceae bacterium]
MTKRRITLVGLVAFLVFGLLMGGQIIYKKFWLDASMLQKSQEIPGVLSAKIVEVNGQQELDVETGKIIDLPATSMMLEKLAGKMPIRYLDQRNDELEQILKQMQFSLQESIVRGNFTEMERNVKVIADNAGVQINLNMDNNNIYLVLNKGEAQLVAVLERNGQARFLTSNKNLEGG